MMTARLERYASGRKETTAADGYFRGYNIIAVDDCITCTLEEDKIRALDWVKGYCGIVMSSGEILEAVKNNKPIEFPIIKIP